MIEEGTLLIKCRERIKLPQTTSLLSMRYYFGNLINKYGNSATYIPLDFGYCIVEYYRPETDKERTSRKKHERRLTEQKARSEMGLWKKFNRQYGNK